MRRKTVHVTDHALVRWLERGHNIDMEGLRSELAELAQPFASVAAATGKVGDLYFIYQGNKLVTVQPSKPDVTSLRRNDRGAPPPKPERLPWQALKRKRSR